MTSTPDHMTASARDGRIVRRYFILFFLVLIAVQAVLITLATRTHTGLITDHPYEKGLAYNDVVKAAEQQEALGWKDEMTFSSRSAGVGTLHFLLRDKNGTLLQPDSVTFSAIRPTQDGLDFSGELQVEDKGAAMAELRFPLVGVWDVRVQARVNGQTYQQSKRVVVE